MENKKTKTFINIHHPCGRINQEVHTSVEEKLLEEIELYLDNEDIRLKKALHEFGNNPRNEYSGVLLGKAEIVCNLKRLIRIGKLKGGNYGS